MSTIDLSTLPSPNVVEALSFETIFAAMLNDLCVRDPSFTALVESDPAYKVLEVCAYRELLLRARVNDSCRAVMLASATGSDLDQIAANFFGCERLLVTPANASAIPPVAAVYEADAAFRSRILLSIDALSVAGPASAYVYWAKSASGAVKDASCVSPTPGDVLVSVLGTTGDGTPTAATLAAVTSALTDEDVRPLTDNVTVQAATIVPYRIEAQIYTKPGPDAAVVMAASRAAASAYAAQSHALGCDITLSAIYAALHQAGVQRVVLASPAADISIPEASAPHCTEIVLTHSGTAQ